MVAWPSGADAAAIYAAQPATGTIVQVDTNTGGLFGAYDAPDDLQAGHVGVGLSGAEGGDVLLYGNGDGSTPDDLYRLDPTTGSVHSTEIGYSIGYDGLSYEELGGTDYVFFSDSGIDIHRQEDTPARRPSSGPRALRSADWAATDRGREFGYFDDGSIHEYDPATEAAPFTSTLPSPAADVQGMAFDGTNLYVSTASGSLYTLDPDTGAVLDGETVTGGALYGLAVANGTIVNQPPPVEPPPEEPPPIDPPTDPGALPAPVSGTSVNVEPVSGKVTAKCKGDNGFRALTDPEQVAVGCLIDTTKGRVRLTSETDTDGETQSAVFYDGVFRIKQKTGEAEVTLKLSGELDCGKGGKRLLHERGRRRRGGRGLFGDGNGDFTTQGNNGAGSVRGTKWFVGDNCDNTTTVTVKKGVVSFRDFVADKTIKVEAGESYTTEPRGK